MAFGGKQFHCQMSCDHELANEGARCSGKKASYITIPFLKCSRFVVVVFLYAATGKTFISCLLTLIIIYNNVTTNVLLTSLFSCIIYITILSKANKRVELYPIFFVVFGKVFGINYDFGNAKSKPCVPLSKEH